MNPTQTPTASTILAVDLGASSGRVLAFQWKTDPQSTQGLVMEQVHRFPNFGVMMGEHLMWNLPGLWHEIVEGITKAVKTYGADSIASIGVDTWGVDFAFLTDSDELLTLPYHYRDRQNEGMLEQAFEVVPREEIYQHTGLQFMNINSLYQLLAIRKRQPEIFARVRHFLMIPDLFHWLLSGKISHEKTDSSTSQLYDPRQQAWSDQLISKFDLPRSMFGELTEPGTTLGGLRESLLQQTGASAETKVILPASHDTASAVLAVPRATPTHDRPDWCYISSGTWSLMGIETRQPIISEQSSEWNFTNEAGAYGTNRVLKNIAGLWLIQECQRIWKREGNDYSWEQIVQMARKAPEGHCFIDPDDPTLVAPEHMPDAIATLATKAGHPLSSHGAIARCAFDSLALRYARVLGMLEQLAGERIETIHIVGGGAQNDLLCQMTANACQRRVLAGPTEGTAIGNAMVQAISLGWLEDYHQARQILSQLEPPREYKPANQERWETVVNG